MAGGECPSPPPTSLVQALDQEGQESAPPLAVGSQDRKDHEGRWSNLFISAVGTLRPRARAYCSRSPSDSEAGPKASDLEYLF